MSNCLNCAKELIHIEGRRKKIFCNAGCKNAYWRGIKSTPKYVRLKTFQELKERLDNLELENEKLKEDATRAALMLPKTENKPIVAPIVKEQAKDKPPVTRNQLGALKVANDTLSEILDEPKSKQLTKEQYKKLPFTEQRQYKNMYGEPK